MIEENIIRALLEDPGLDVDFFLVDLAVMRDNKVRVYVDSMNGITIDECVEISRFLETRLDEKGYIFELEVSSPGLDMPFKVAEQFEKNIGERVQVVFQDGGKKTGTLVSFDGEVLGMEAEIAEKLKGKKQKLVRTVNETIPFEDIKTIKRIISF